MKVSALGKGRAATPSYNSKIAAKKNKQHPLDKNAHPSQKKARSLVRNVNKSLAKLSPALKSTQKKKLGRASIKMMRETTARYNMTRP